MKVVEELVGIAQQSGALSRFFLTGPELQTISQETPTMCGSSFKSEARKHRLNNEAEAKLKDKAIAILYGELQLIGNPFQFESREFVNAITKAVFNEKIISDVTCRPNRIIREKNFETFKSDRLLGGSIDL